MRLFVVILAISLSNVCFGQFDPAGGKPGSHAVHRDNASISYWGDSVEVVRGNQRINASTPIPVITGDENDALGPADDRTISLGDGGQATYVFDREVSNIDGPDFVVFENGFDSETFTTSPRPHSFFSSCAWTFVLRLIYFL